ncbi:efflux RND transporter permease subunit [Lentimicrobium sp. S6]|uniref:efflux RND transporter permease subunit n=1 Tax=Lentimicrobium sp. S6 TaxID=2735872 RepID=UPI0015531110|nr:efflux RND transporter permease subunit [Lentimicrobium sp. S6]NPD47838.1 efflux RND transporter permease subunit [Lentimicrobium sp. S6]
MSENKQDKKVKREFKLTSIALSNKNTIYLLTTILIAFGLYSYRSLPKELFPDVFFPTIMVNTIYPGNPPLDMENLVTRPLEKEIDGVKGMKKLTSTSSQDMSAIFVEFNTDLSIEEALREVKDAVDNAKNELPDDLPNDPMVMDIDFSEFPVLTINLSGDFSISELKDYAEYIEDEVEDINEVSKVEIKGLMDNEVSIWVDLHKMESNKISFNDIEMAIANENLSISGGELRIDGTMRSVRVLGEFSDVKQMEGVIVKSENNNIVYLRDIAEIEYGFADPESFARLDLEPVVSLQIVKKSGKNLLSAIDQVFEKMEHAQKTGALPTNLKISYTNDQSEQIRAQISNLENSLIMGIIFVILVLFFFLGTRNSLFVGFAIPTSMFISFVIFNLIGYKINMIVLFALILALGMLVDNAIVVVENVYRFVTDGESNERSSKYAVGEIAWPIITSTLTTLAAFFPLIFWDSLMGEFMKFLPITLIIVLTSSLFVALILIPVYTSIFMKKGAENDVVNKKSAMIWVIALTAFSAIAYTLTWNVMGGLSAFFATMGLANVLFLNRLGIWFKNVFLVWLESFYEGVIHFAIKGKNSVWMILGTIFLLIATIQFMGMRDLKTVFFPSSFPKYVNVIAELPIGTDIYTTDKFISELEADVFQILQPYDTVVKNVLTTVGNGAKSENDGFNISNTPNQGMLTINFIDFELRDGINTFDIMSDLSNRLIGRYPGVFISVEKPAEGPPTGKPINVEISGKEYESLIALTDSILLLMEKENIPGIEGLQLDLEMGNPELLVHIDRDKARRFGLSTGQIAMTIRTALFGNEISQFKVGEDEYPIQLRLQDKYRYDISSLMNQKITFRNASNGRIMQVPISAVATFSYSTTYGQVKRKSMDRVITIQSNVLEGYNANDINAQLKPLMAAYDMPEGFKYEFTGEQEEQEESMIFLVTALIIAVSLITIILVSQFNSIVKPLIIIGSVLFSTIGVIGGIATFKMDFVVIMTGIGIVSLAGVVVNNAIVLIDYIDLLKRGRRKELGLEEGALLTKDDAMQCVEEAGKTRLRPVLLTAITTILGLLPMAIGLNINFETLLTDLDPQIYFGGDNMVFWGALSWTVIFGLSFATFLTLVIVPSMYHFAYLVKLKLHTWKS